jgi:hypothetical protein
MSFTEFDGVPVTVPAPDRGQTVRAWVQSWRPKKPGARAKGAA